MAPFLGMFIGGFGYILVKSGVQLRPYNKINTTYLVIGVILLAIAGYLIIKIPF